MIHDFTCSLPAGYQIAAVQSETLPVPVTSAGRGGSIRPVPVCSDSCSAGLANALSDGRPGARVTDEDGIFSVTKNCTSCGTCVAVCPVKNIEMAGKRPAWEDHCELCLACIRTCPAQAIRVRQRGDNRSSHKSVPRTISSSRNPV